MKHTTVAVALPMHERHFRAKIDTFWEDAAGRILAFRGPHAARGPHVVHPCSTPFIQFETQITTNIVLPIHDLKGFN